MSRNYVCNENMLQKCTKGNVTKNVTKCHEM